MSEEWRICCSGYEASNLGRLRKADGTIVSQYPNQDGYMVARLSGPRRVERAHRLVARAFVPNPDRKPNVNHLDCNRANNHASNLEWCTQAENIAYADSLGRTQRNYWAGKRSPSALLADDQVREMRRMYATGGMSFSRVAEMFGVSKRSAMRAINQETYSDVR